MNFNIFYAFAAIFVCFLAAAQGQDIVCPKDQPDDSFVVQFPSPTSCNEYYKCDRGVPVVQRCAANLEYNPKLNVSNLEVLEKIRKKYKENRITVNSFKENILQL